MVDQSASKQLGFFEKAKQFLDPSAVWQNIKNSRGFIFDLALFFCIGFLVGYLLKKYGQYLAVFLVFIALLVLLQQLDVIHVTINWYTIQNALGIKNVQITQGSTLLTIYWEWVKSNVVIAISFAVGFLGGLRVGV
ncbi:MAG: FUN14 domain-containing protein [Candidatus Babeliales bacterium]|nr:FUN14 domain-containing protein [Candidatus Babeliales bacterium]